MEYLMLLIFKGIAFITFFPWICCCNFIDFWGVFRHTYIFLFLISWAFCFWIHSFLQIWSVWKVPQETFRHMKHRSEIVGLMQLFFKEWKKFTFLLLLIVVWELRFIFTKKKGDTWEIFIFVFLWQLDLPFCLFLILECEKYLSRIHIFLICKRKIGEQRGAFIKFS